jgi:hypothetical protein
MKSVTSCSNYLLHDHDEYDRNKLTASMLLPLKEKRTPSVSFIIRMATRHFPMPNFFVMAQQL